MASRSERPPGPTAPRMPVSEGGFFPIMSSDSFAHRVHGHNLACFIVEDSPVIRLNLVSTLEELLDVSVVGTAEDEAQAVRWMREPGQSCDLLIIDIFLKSGTGLEVLKAAAQSLPGARRVVLSNYATPDMRRRCLALGADRVFDKSSQLEELFAYCEELAQDGRLN